MRLPKQSRSSGRHEEVENRSSLRPKAVAHHDTMHFLFENSTSCVSRHSARCVRDLDRLQGRTWAGREQAPGGG